MRKAIYLLSLLVLFIASCSDNNKKEPEKEQAITLSADKNTLTADGEDKVTFTVKNQDGKDVTSTVQISVDGKKLSGNTFSTDKEGTYKVIARLNTIQSNELTIQATKKAGTLVLTADKASILANGKDKIKFTVKKADGTDITAKSKISVNNIEISGHEYVATSEGEYKAIAFSEGEQSNELVFQANKEQDIILEADKVEFYLEGDDAKVTFTVKNKDGQEITKDSKIFINEQAIEGNVFTPTATGIFTAQAEYKNNKSNYVRINVKEPIKYGLVIKPDKTRFTSDGIDMVVFTCINTLDKDNDLTTETKFSVNGKEIEGNIYKTTKNEKITVTAKYQKHAAPPVIVESTRDFNPTPRVFVEQFTATWCQYCPRLIVVLEKASQNPQVVASAMHGNDKFGSSDINTVAKYLGVTGYPSMVMNRDKSTLTSNTNVAQILQHIPAKSDLGIAVEVKVEGNAVKTDITFKAKENMPDVKWIAILTENKLIADQTNSVFPELGNPIKDMEHNHVYRQSYQNKLWGEDISFKKGESVKKEIRFDMKTGWKPENCEVLIVITDKDRKVITAQKANANSGRGY